MGQRRFHQPNNTNTLRIRKTYVVFWKRVPAWYIGRKQQRQQLYSRDHNPKGVGTPSFLNNYSRSSSSSNCSKQFSNSRYCMYLEQIKHCFIPYCYPSVTAHGSQTALLLAQLESYHIRPLGAARGPGLLTGVDVHPIPGVHSAH